MNRFILGTQTAESVGLSLGGWVLFAVIAVFLLAILSISAPLLGIYLRAKFAAVNIPFLYLIGARLRRTDTEMIVNHTIQAAKGGVGVTPEDLECHYLAGGDVSRVVRALIAAKQSSIELTFSVASAMDLSGQDVLTIVQKRAGRPVDATEERYSQDVISMFGYARTDLSPSGRVAVWGLEYEARCDGSPIRKGTLVQVTEMTDKHLVVKKAKD